MSYNIKFKLTQKVNREDDNKFHIYIIESVTSHRLNYIPGLKKKGEDGAESGSEKSYLDMESIIDIFTDKGGDVLRQFIGQANS